MSDALSFNGAVDRSADVPRSLVASARAVAAAVAAGNAAFVVWMIATAARQRCWASAYALCIAVPVLVGVLLAFLAAHRRARVRPLTFARVGLTAVLVQGVFTAILAVHAVMLLKDTDAADLATVASAKGVLLGRLALLGLTLVGVAAFAVIRYPARTRAYLRQIAHRAIGLGVWVLAAKLGLAVWRGSASAASSTSSASALMTLDLSPAALGLFVLAGVCALMALWTSRDEAEAFDEARRLTWAAGAFLLVTLAVISCSTLF
jgi:hypothetical protein